MEENTSNTSPVVNALYASGLKMLGMTYDSLAYSGFKSIVVEMIKNKTTFDISTVESINNLSAEDIDKLRKFETENAGILVDMIRLADTLGYEAAEQHKINSLMDSLNDKNGLQNTFKYWFSAAVIFISFIYIFCITWIPIPESSLRAADVVLGVVISSVISVIMNYFYGSSLNKANQKNQVPNVEQGSGAFDNDNDEDKN